MEVYLPSYGSARFHEHASLVHPMVEVVRGQHLSRWKGLDSPLQGQDLFPGHGTKVAHRRPLWKN